MSASSLVRQAQSNTANSGSALFAYGTLMSPSILEAVIGVRLAPEPARLADYARWSIANEVYPALVPEPGAHVLGVLYRDIPLEAWRRLDDFEGSEYVAHRVDVSLTRTGERYAAVTYLLHPDQRARIDRTPWDFETFMRRDIGRFARLAGQTPGGPRQS